MELIAIGALTISFVSLIGTIINSVFIVKTYKKNRRLEFLQRRDYLSQKISDLNDRNTEAQLFSARYALLAVKTAGLALRGEEAERNVALIAYIIEQREGVEKGIKLFDEHIESLHFMYRKLASETYASAVEILITGVQLASDSLKKANSSYSSILHMLETTNEMMKTDLAERDEKIRQISLELERAIEKLK